MSGDGLDNCPNSNLPIPTKLFSEEEAIVHAHLCGDGCVWREIRKRTPADLRTHKRRKLTRETWVLNFTNTSKELLGDFSQNMFQAFSRKTAKMKKGIDLRASSVKNILLRLRLIGKNSYNWFIPQEVTLASTLVKRAWLRSFFDDEGSVEGSNVTVSSVNKSGLQQVNSLLNGLGINTTFNNFNNNKNVIRIRNESLYEFFKLVNFKHPKKRARLEKLIEKRFIFES